MANKITPTLSDFSKWMRNDSGLAKGTISQYKREIKLLWSQGTKSGRRHSAEVWKNSTLNEVMEELQSDPEWRENNKTKHYAMSAAVGKYFEFVGAYQSKQFQDDSSFLRETFLSRKAISDVTLGLRAKKNIILQGPPGTGKTYIAKRLAYALMEEEAKDRVEVVQFHQSYSYEDFIQGFRPKEGGRFERRDGVFFRFCDKARRDPGRDYFFLIDEINRGNLSKIFGELMMLIEADKRGESNHVQLTYSKEGEHFSIPENVHIIGTMNTADRSLAMVDYALRRRFAFFHMPPQFNDKFEAYLQEEHSISASMVKRIVAKLTALNKTIQGDDNLCLLYTSPSPRD